MTILTAKELSERIKVKPVTLYAWSEAEKIPSVKLNSSVRFVWEDIVQWMQKGQKGYNQPALTRCSGNGGRK
jgi:predicted site-specific integrase-resolvase